MPILNLGLSFGSPSNNLHGVKLHKDSNKVSSGKHLENSLFLARGWKLTSFSNLTTWFHSLQVLIIQNGHHSQEIHELQQIYK